MNILTYYYNGKGLEYFTNIVSISYSITQGTDESLRKRGIKYRHYTPLAPDWKTIVGPYRDGLITESEYIRRYHLLLDKRNPHQIVSELGEDAILLCYENPTLFCHRHIVARWLTLNGYPTTEYEYTTPLNPTLEEEWKF